MLTLATTPANILAQASLRVFPLAVATAFKASAVTSTPLVPTTTAEREATSSCFCASLSPSNDETGMISGGIFCELISFKRVLDIIREKLAWSNHCVSYHGQLQDRKYEGSSNHSDRHYTTTMPKLYNCEETFSSTF